MIGADRFVHRLCPDHQAQHATQRYQRGWSEMDMWNFDSMLADLVVAACTWQLDCAKTGGPWDVTEDQWKQILLEIREGFSVVDPAGSPRPTMSAWILLMDNFSHMWD